MENTVVTTQQAVTSALQTVGSTLTSNISPAMIVSVIGIVLGSCVALYLTWFGIRKLVSAVKGALKGRLSV